MPNLEQLVSNAGARKLRLEAADRPRVAVCVDTSSIADGALETLAAIRDAVRDGGIEADIDQVGGNGLSFAYPIVEVARPDGTRVLYQHVSAADAGDFVQAVLVRGEMNNRWTLGALAGSPEGVPAMDSHPWWAIQTRRMMAEMGRIDPEDIDDALATGAYSGLSRAMSMTQEEVIAEVIDSTLGGRGGSYFPTGRKWDFLRTSPTNPKNIVCNADEGDPGAWVNRMTMECDPHALLEGMMIAGWSTGAQKGYVYIREEYPLAFERVQKAVDQAYERGVLGQSVLGSDWSFDMTVVRGAGSYVCGEESGLIASIEDARGMPKIRPPFPAASGVFGEGSNVNNVESYHTATWVMRHGVEAWKTTGTEQNAGGKMFCASGHVARVGCFELPFGTPLRQLLEVCAGGLPEGRRIKAIQIGGPLTGITPEFYLDLGMEPQTYRANKLGSLGGGGFVFMDDSTCVVDVLAQIHWFVEDESCGRCTTCHGGSQRMVEILRRIQRGGGRESDIGKMRLLCDTLRYSNCQHGQLAPVTILHTLDWFIDDVNDHIYQRRCRAHVCEGLTAYEADRDAAGRPEYAEALARANRACLRVLRGERTDACLDCFVCHELLPEVVRTVDRFEAGVGPAPELISVQPAEV